MRRQLIGEQQRGQRLRKVIFGDKKGHVRALLLAVLQCLEMTTKRKLIGRLVPCRCFRGEEEIISVLDYSHCSLQQVPKEVFNFERTLEELYLDANQIEELPKQIPPECAATTDN
ncbi:hypothetical protein ACRRTK_022487 [Alexandromys fortis]